MNRGISIANMAMTMAAMAMLQTVESNTASQHPNIIKEVDNTNTAPEDPRVAGYRAERAERRRINFLKRASKR